jgi:RNA polymerase sigma-70 factor (ECF subfamily)
LSEGARRAEVRRILERCLDELPVSFGTIFVMRELEEMSVRETAECLGIPESSVRSRLFRARTMLSEAFVRALNEATVDLFGFAGGRCDRIVENVMTRLPDAPERSGGPVHLTRNPPPQEEP